MTLPQKPAGSLIYLGTVLPEDATDGDGGGGGGGGPLHADVVLPIANVAEEEGTFVNRDGRVQRYLQAKPAPGMAQPAWWVLGELGALLGVERGGGVGAPASAAAAFDRLAATVLAFAGLSYAQLGLGGAAPRAGVEVPAP